MLVAWLRRLLYLSGARLLCLFGRVVFRRRFSLCHNSNQSIDQQEKFRNDSPDKAQSEVLITPNPAGSVAWIS